MDSVTSGSIAGTGSFRCESCGYVLTLDASDPLPGCPECGGAVFVRASMFNQPAGEEASGETATHPVQADPREGTLIQAPSPERSELLARTRAQLDVPGEYLCYEDGGEMRTVALTREWTRVGRSLAADLRFDDPTVSRRHALIVRHADGVRVLDDRSLNGVFVNGARVDGRSLADGDEIIVGRYRLVFISIPEHGSAAPAGGASEGSAGQAP